MKHTAAIIGVSGYIGGEILHILSEHPYIKITGLFGNESAGKTPSEIHNSLINFNDITISKISGFDPDNYDVVFSALPNGETVKHWDKLKNCKLLIDASSDFRLHSNDDYEKYYGKHPQPDACKLFTYGQPELFRDKIKEAKQIASPGCFATSVILGLYPIIKNKLNEGPVFVSSVTGSSGSGNKPKEKTHHPLRAESLFAYEPLKHRHIPEIKQAIKYKVSIDPDFTLQAHSGPFSRGIYSTLLFKTSNNSINEIIKEEYKGESFIKVTNEPPNIKHIKGTNFVLIHAAQNDGFAAVYVAIDNLVKGGGGQAVQCMNIAMGFEESCGLMRYAPII